MSDHNKTHVIIAKLPFFVVAVTLRWRFWLCRNKICIIDNNNSNNNNIDLARAKSEALVNDTYKQKTELYRVILNGEGNENGIKINRSN